MLDKDLVSVVAIERQVQVMPWSRLLFEEAMSASNVCCVVELNDVVSAFHVGAVVLDEWHILNLAVSSTMQGIGLGHVLINDIIQQAESNQCRKLFLEVRQTNAIAQALYQKWGFEQLAIRKKYYRLPNTSNKEDALVYVKTI